MNEKLPEQVEQVLLGSLLGDGSLCKNKSMSKGVYKTQSIGIHFIEEHSINQENYLLWKKEILSQVFVIKRFDRRKNVYIYSTNSPLFNEYYNYFYPLGKGHKIFTLKMLNKLKPLGLAVWYMDDGCFLKTRSSSIALHKQNGKIVEKWFKETLNFNVKSYTRKFGNGAEIILNKRDTRKFFRIIHPYIHPSMKYKIKITRADLIKIINYKKRYHQKYREKNRKRLNEYNTKYYQENKEKCKKAYNQRPEVKKRIREYRGRKNNIPPERWRIKE